MRHMVVTDSGVLAAEQAEEVGEVLQNEGVVVFPTETFYGLGCDPCSEAAVRRLCAIKQRPEGQPLPLVAADSKRARQLVVLATAREEMLWEALSVAFWPGPLTLVAGAAGGLAPGVAADSGTVAVRVPGLALTRQLAALSGAGLVATSANRSGQPPPTTATEAAQSLGVGLDLLVESGPAPGGRPSTLVALSAGQAEILRDGAISGERVRQVVEQAR